ncbi:MAG: acyl-CoA thioesterase [Myxococcota bacterium]|nr:acyl-CoA thioesterase [Myxococcota bacterium]
MSGAVPLSPRDSYTEMTEIVLPQHANALGTAFGGTVLSWIDVCAAVVAQRHCGRIAVTAAIDDVQFLAPLHVGDVVRLFGRVNGAFARSVEVEVTVEREDAATRARCLCADALLTFVPVDPLGRPMPVPPLLAENDDDRRRATEAAERRARRLERKRTSR